MEKEISSGTMLGIVLIALAAVIGLGFGVFSIAKGVANEGVVNVQDNLSTVSESAFEDFDQKIVTGTQVMSAYKQFQGKPVGVLISTNALHSGVSTAASHADKYVQSLGSRAYLNYNAILSDANDGTFGSGNATLNNTVGGTIAVPSTDTLTLDAGIVKSDFGFHIDATTGKVIFDSNIGGFNKAGNAEFISTSAKFDANLIKDPSGTIIGVMFTQLAR